MVDPSRPPEQNAAPVGGGAPVPIRHVMVPLDGSPGSEQAIPVAAAVARRHGAIVTLVHVREEADVMFGLPDGYPASLREEPRLGDDLDVRLAVLYGPVSETLLGHIDAAGVDLVVLTSRGRGGIKRAVRGSVADAVIRDSRIPVLVIYPGDETKPPAVPAGEALPFRRVLLPLDGSEAAEAIIPHTLELTGTERAHYLVLRVRPGLLPVGQIEPWPLLARPSDPVADGYLSSIAARISDQGVLVSELSVTNAWPADVILKVAEEEGVDLIAMVTWGTRGVDRMLFGSVADRVAREAHCAVLLLRPPVLGTPPRA